MSQVKNALRLPWKAATVAALLAVFVSGCGGNDSTESPVASFDPALAVRLQAQLDQSRTLYKALGAVAGGAVALLGSARSRWGDAATAQWSRWREQYERASAESPRN